MKLTEFFRAELDREVERSRKTLEQVPDGKFDWKPHERSMAFGYLANMVASIPSWITMEINRDELDVHPPKGQETQQEFTACASGRHVTGTATPTVAANLPDGRSVAGRIVSVTVEPVANGSC